MDTHINAMLDQYERGRFSRRQLVATLTGFAALGAGLGRDAVAQATRGDDGPTFQATAVNHVALRVTDVPRSRDFYVKHLGLRVTSDGTNSCFLDCGPDFLALFRGDTPGLDHYCFTIKDYSAGDAVETLKAAGLEPRRASNRVYFDDPDGIEVQVSAPNE